MKEDSFEKFLKDLCSFFDRDYDALVKKETDIAWFESLEFIPEQALEWIEDQMKTGQWPRDNFPQAVVALYHRYNQLNPPRPTISIVECPDCDQGLIFAEQPGENKRAVFTCLRCEQAKNGFPKAKLAALIKAGWRKR